jgi:hypothetical protein
MVSEAFPVTVANMAPMANPFTATQDPRTFTVSPPVYDGSQVLWNTTALALTKTAGVGYQVQIPATISGQGQLIWVRLLWNDG